MNDADTLTRLTMGPLPGLREPKARPDRVAERAQAIALRPAPVSRVRSRDAQRELDGGDDESALREPIAGARAELAPPRLAVFAPPQRSFENAASERIAMSPLSPARSPSASPVEGSRSVVETVERIVEPRIVAPAVEIDPPRAPTAARREAPPPVTSEQARVVRSEPLGSTSSKVAERITTTLIEHRRAEAPPQPSLAPDRPRPERASVQPHSQALVPMRQRELETERVQTSSTRRSSETEPTRTITTRPTTPSPTAEVVARPAAKLVRVAVDASARATEARPRGVAIAEPRPVAKDPRPVARGPMAAPRPNPPAPPSVRVSVGRIEIRTTPTARTPSRRASAPARAHAITPVLPGVV